MKKDKDNAALDFYEMIQKSWTWERLTKEEQKRFRRRLESFDCYGRIKGSYETRYEHCHQLYQMFLEALCYDPLHWREPENGTVKPLF